MVEYEGGLGFFSSWKSGTERGLVGLCRSDATSHIIRPVEDVAQGENPASPAMIRIKEEGV
jgi:hypothetical protein